MTVVKVSYCLWKLDTVMLFWRTLRKVPKRTNDELKVPFVGFSTRSSCKNTYEQSTKFKAFRHWFVLVPFSKHKNTTWPYLAAIIVPFTFSNVVVTLQYWHFWTQGTVISAT